MDKYQKQITEADEFIPKLDELISKPFEKETELQQMKSSLSSLEREIALKIQEKQEQLDEQLKVTLEIDTPAETNSPEAIIVSMSASEITHETRIEKVVNGADHDSASVSEQMELKKSKGLRI
ncbi:hypothetical protein [Mucilaginibacter lappiensis]|uniref:Transcription termination factor NusB n=1 Tax=Mucilaginibacter lappiensis TaxID=354630 RepID=A0A841JAP9_9SPHI|nr:hypothetical protein [Mucilaginibacter lappiensis]MBB6127432.1 transcription termination factor NusB [Mucilaginibacter lappiensis]